MKSSPGILPRPQWCSDAKAHTDDIPTNGWLVAPKSLFISQFRPMFPPRNVGLCGGAISGGPGASTSAMRSVESRNGNTRGVSLL